MKILLIGNPAAGKVQGRAKIVELIQLLQQRGVRLETFLTRHPGDAKRRAYCIEPDVERLLVAGGDGTLNEVLNGLPDPSRIPLVLFPLGTSNVMAQELALANNLESIVTTLERGNIRRVDMGIIGDHRFLLFVSVGLDAMVMEKVFQIKRNRGGYSRYIFPVLKVLAHYHPPHLRITVDDFRDLKGGMVLVGNTRHYGGIFSIADRARYDSGHLDICIVPEGTFTSLARYYCAAARKKVSQDRKIHYVTGTRIRIESAEPVAVQVDGDYFGTTPVHINCKASFVPLVVPPYSV